MGKEEPEVTTTTYERQPLEGSLWAYGNVLDFWNALMSGEGPSYPGPLMTPQEHWGSQLYQGALASLFGEPGAEMGGTIGAGQQALERILSPEFLNVGEDPYVQAALENVLAGTRHRMGAAGLGYGTSLADAEMRSAADLLLGETGRRQALQAELAPFAQQFPLEALSGFAPWAALPFTRNYGEWVRGLGLTTEAGHMLGQLALGGAGQPYPTSVAEPGAGWGDVLGPMLMAAGYAGGFPNLFGKV